DDRAEGNDQGKAEQAARHVLDALRHRLHAVPLIAHVPALQLVEVPAGAAREVFDTAVVAVDEFGAGEATQLFVGLGHAASYAEPVPSSGPPAGADEPPQGNCQ